MRRQKSITLTSGAAAAAAVLALFLCAPLSAQAQDLKAKNLRIVVPVPPVLAVVEVKSRAELMAAGESVTPEKQRRLARAAR